MPDKTTTRKAEKVTGPTSGVLAQGAVGRAARDAAAAAQVGPVGSLPAWDRPDAKYKDDDTSIDARMWRLKQDHIEMGSRTK